MRFVLRCRQCNALVSNPVQRVEWDPLPKVTGRLHYSLGASTVAAGYCSTDPQPFRFRVDPSPVPHAAMTVVINPVDAVQMRHHTKPTRLHGCCRLDGIDGPNLLCCMCGVEIGVEISDCWTEYDVRLLRSAVIEDRLAADEQVIAME